MLTPKQDTRYNKLDKANGINYHLKITMLLESLLVKTQFKQTKKYCKGFKNKGWIKLKLKIMWPTTDIIM